MRLIGLSPPHTAHTYLLNYHYIPDIVCMRSAYALARLSICTGSSEPKLVTVLPNSHELSINHISGHSEPYSTRTKSD